MPKRQVDMLLKNASQLLTFSEQLHPEKSIISDGAIAVDHGRIVDIGKTGELESRFESDETLDVTGKIVTPGLIDCHTHLIFAGSREQELDMRLSGMSYMDILRSGGGILKTMYATREASKEKLVEEGKKVLDSMMLNGTTTVEAKSGYGLTVEHETKMLLAAKDLSKQHPLDIVPTFLGAHAFPPEYKDAPDEYVRVVATQMIPQIAREGLAEFCDVFCDKGAFSVEQARNILVAGIEQGLRPKIHVDEFANIGGAKLAIELQAVSAEHLLHSSSDDLTQLSRAGVIPVFLPAASLTLMEDRFADAVTLLKNGLPFALASDFNPSCPTKSLQFVLALSCYCMKTPIIEALRALTLTAAKALRKSHDVGSLEPGKKADLVIFDVADYRFLLQHLGVNLVSKVVKRGVVVAEEGRATRAKSAD
ncbi:imidazolonepropionase [Candidatus Bathyarchaeota archaeon]|nr:imidazolonepropionase [Candidatus Bathyarchaeota archaeon]